MTIIKQLAVANVKRLANRLVKHLVRLPTKSAKITNLADCVMSVKSPSCSKEDSADFYCRVHIKQKSVWSIHDSSV